VEKGRTTHSPWEVLGGHADLSQLPGPRSQHQLRDRVVSLLAVGSRVLLLPLGFTTALCLSPPTEINGLSILGRQ
jgi:hypothetical protein